jgi:GNAT superfamily N-acetyltransferase
MGSPYVTIDAPVPLNDSHELDSFCCGVPPLDDWLKRRARANTVSGATQTYVACENTRAVGYFALAAGAVDVVAAPGRFRRNMPDPIPIVVLGRLGINRTQQGKGLGRALFRDAGLRVLQAASIIGVRGMLVEAISEEAKAFYLALGLVVSPLDPMTLMVTIADLRASLMSSSQLPQL